MDFEIRRRKDPVQPQLTALIDVFSIIIIFLVAGTVFGTSSIILPKSLTLPKSFGKESIVSAPQLSISKDRVSTTLSDKVYPMEIFSGKIENDPRLNDLKAEIKIFIANLRPEAKNAGILLNVVADRDLPYQMLFDVISVYRANGFQSLLFIAEGEKEAKVADAK